MYRYDMAVVTKYIISLFKQNAIGHNAISLHKVLTLFWAETDNFGTQLREICPPAARADSSV